MFKPCDSETDLECFIGGEGRSYAYDPIVRLKPKIVKIEDIQNKQDIQGNKGVKEAKEIKLNHYDIQKEIHDAYNESPEEVIESNGNS